MTRTETYRITYTDGRCPGNHADHPTHESACAAILAEWPEAEIGHDGDLTDSGDRTLAWASQDDAIDDDGSSAVASIHRIGRRP